MTYTDAEIAALKERLNSIDPDFVQASKEVDRATLRFFADVAPLERIRSATRSAHQLKRLARSKRGD